MSEVSIVACSDYSEEKIRPALSAAIEAVGGLGFDPKGLTVALKVNLVSPMKPEQAATTHPSIVCALVSMLKDAGAARVIIGDSPGGLYNAAALNRAYTVSGMRNAESLGAELNWDFSHGAAHFPEGVSAREFPYTAYLDSSDVIIDVCKLKTHGMMGMSCAAKNMFGVIPGTIKPEFHYKYPDHMDFAHMIVDLDEYFKPVLSVCDAVTCMEGNGPTMGTPRHMGAILVSTSPHKLDLACSRLIGLKPEEIPTLQAAAERGLIPESADGLDISGDLDTFALPDFEKVVSKSIRFNSDSKSVLGRAAGAIAQRALQSRPSLEASSCVGCGECARVCPAKAIDIRDKKAHINTKKCIRCFCCQEFCPVGAMKVRRTAISRILGGN